MKLQAHINTTVDVFEKNVFNCSQSGCFKGEIVCQP